MTKQDALQTFFDAYETLQRVPKAKGAPSMEMKAARDHLERCADAVRNCEQPVAPQGLGAFRSMQQTVASIQPVDTRGPRKIQTLNITNG